ncbi:unnamed protein product [marine sediment metagenome]|uniref:Uncharacterized protein n=1 Tax=marine sediment metagenome TaxID=412755 RepID=X0VJK6_9ZZZZ
MLEALNKPAVTDTVVYYKRNRKGEVIEERTRVYSISMVHVIAGLTLIYGPEIMNYFRTEIVEGAASTVTDAARSLFDKIFGPGGVLDNPDTIDPRLPPDVYKKLSPCGHIERNFAAGRTTRQQYESDKLKYNCP